MCALQGPSANRRSPKPTDLRIKPTLHYIFSGICDYLPKFISDCGGNYRYPESIVRDVDLHRITIPIQILTSPTFSEPWTSNTSTSNICIFPRHESSMTGRPKSPSGDGRPQPLTGARKVCAPSFLVRDSTDVVLGRLYDYSVYCRVC